MNIEKRYKWMYITNDGLVKEPEEQGPYYDTSDLNGWRGFANEADAITEWKKFKKEYGWGVPTELILVPFYYLGD